MTIKKKVRAGLMGEWVFTKLGVPEASTREGGWWLPSPSKVKREREGVLSHMLLFYLNFG